MCSFISMKYVKQDHFQFTTWLCDAIVLIKFKGFTLHLPLIRRGTDFLEMSQSILKEPWWQKQ